MKNYTKPNLNQMSFEEINAWAAGLLILCIGEGTFQEGLEIILSAVMNKGYDDGFDDGLHYPELPSEEEILEAEKEFKETGNE